MKSRSDLGDIVESQTNHTFIMAFESLDKLTFVDIP